MIAADFARLVEKSDATVSRLLAGERRPSIELVVVIANKIGWPVEEQVRSIYNGTYGWDLETKMEAAANPQ